MVLSVFLVIGSAEAFCVYNKTDIEIEVVESSGHKWNHGFRVYINPGWSDCCSWQDSNCNKEGNRDSIVEFIVTNSSNCGGVSMMRLIWECGIICKDFPIKAGGDLTVEGRNGIYRCVRYDY